MEIILSILIILAICFGPTTAYLLYTRNRPEPFADRK